MLTCHWRKFYGLGLGKTEDRYSINAACHYNLISVDHDANIVSISGSSISHMIKLSIEMFSYG